MKHKHFLSVSVQNVFFRKPSPIIIRNFIRYYIAQGVTQFFLTHSDATHAALWDDLPRDLAHTPLPFPARRHHDHDHENEYPPETETEIEIWNFLLPRKDWLHVPNWNGPYQNQHVVIHNAWRSAHTTTRWNMLIDFDEYMVVTGTPGTPGAAPTATATATAFTIRQFCEGLDSDNKWDALRIKRVFFDHAQCIRFANETDHEVDALSPRQKLQRMRVVSYHQGTTAAYASKVLYKTHSDIRRLHVHGILLRNSSRQTDRFLGAFIAHVRQLHELHGNCGTWIPLGQWRRRRRRRRRRAQLTGTGTATGQPPPNEYECTSVDHTDCQCIGDAMNIVPELAPLRMRIRTAMTAAAAAETGTGTDTDTNTDRECKPRF